jgi:hypothetical protein
VIDGGAGAIRLMNDEPARPRDDDEIAASAHRFDAVARRAVRLNAAANNALWVVCNATARVA